jgi:hypothetical protein
MTQPLAASDEVVQRILELSADLQIKRRATTRYSLEFHDYSVAIAAYGKVLEALTMVQPREEETPATTGLIGLLGISREPQAAF